MHQRRQPDRIRVALGASRWRVVWHGLTESCVLVHRRAAGVGWRPSPSACSRCTPRVPRAESVHRLDRLELCARLCARVGHSIRVAFGCTPRGHRDTRCATRVEEPPAGVGVSAFARRSRWQRCPSVALLIGAGLSLVTLQRVDAGFAVDAVKDALCWRAPPRSIPGQAGRLQSGYAAGHHARVDGKRYPVCRRRYPKHGDRCAGGAPHPRRPTLRELACGYSRLFCDDGHCAPWARLHGSRRTRRPTGHHRQRSTRTVVLAEGRSHWQDDRCPQPRQSRTYGVAGDLRRFGLDDEIRPMVYYSAMEVPVFGQMYLVWRSAVDPQSSLRFVTRYAA